MRCEQRNLVGWWRWWWRWCEGWNVSPVVVITDQSRVVSAGLWQHMLLAASLHRPDQGQRWTHTTLAATPSPLPPPAPPVPPHSSPLQQNCINMSALSCCSTRQTTVFQVCHNDNARQSKWLVVVISPTARTTCLYCDCWIIPLYVGSVLLLAGHALVSLFLEKLPPTWMVKDR